MTRTLVPVLYCSRGDSGIPPAFCDKSRRVACVPQAAHDMDSAWQRPRSTAVRSLSHTVTPLPPSSLGDSSPTHPFFLFPLPHPGRIKTSRSLLCRHFPPAAARTFVSTHPLQVEELEQRRFGEKLCTCRNPLQPAACVRSERPSLGARLWPDRGEHPDAEVL